jgi:hypothetical protein
MLVYTFHILENENFVDRLLIELPENHFKQNSMKILKYA